MSRVLTTDDIKAIFELIEKLAPEWTDYIAADDSEGAEPPKKIPLSALKTLLVPYNGAQNNVNLGAHDITGINAFFDALHLSTTPASIPTDIGAVYWDVDAQTYSVVLPNGVTLQIGEELYVNVARDAVAPNPILDGTPVYTTGESGQRPKVNVARADDTAKIKVTGIATHDIANLGRITSFGLIRGVPLARKPAGETWVAGQYLWLAPTGGMTNVEPSSPMPNVRLGLIVNVTGSASFDMLVYIRPAMGIYDLYDVNGDAPTDGQEHTYDETLGYWKATSRLNTLEADDATEGSVLKSIKDNAKDATYDNSISGLTAGTLGGAIDEVEARVDDVEGHADDIDNAIDAIKGVGYTEGTLKTHEDALTTLNADDETEGSVAKAVKDAVSPIEEDLDNLENVFRYSAISKNGYINIFNDCESSDIFNVSGGEFCITGENLLDTSSKVSNKIKNDSGEEVSDSNSHYYSRKIPVVPGMILSSNFLVQRYYLLDSSGTFIERTEVGGTPYNITIPSDVYFVQVQTSRFIETESMMLNFGDTASDYSAFKINTDGIAYEGTSIVGFREQVTNLSVTLVKKISSVDLILTNSNEKIPTSKAVLDKIESIGGESKTVTISDNVIVVDTETSKRITEITLPNNSYTVGKNIFDQTTRVVNKIKNDSGVEVHDTVSNYFSIYIPANGMSFKANFDIQRCYLYDENKTFLRRHNNYIYSETEFSFSNEVYFIQIQMEVEYITNNLCMVYGDNDTTYSKYRVSQNSRPYGEEFSVFIDGVQDCELSMSLLGLKSFIPKVSSYDIWEPSTATDDYSCTPLGAYSQSIPALTTTLKYQGFLETYFDIYLGEYADGYSVKREDLGLDSGATATGNYASPIYSYEFKPKYYNKTVLLSAGMNTCEASTYFGLAYFIKALMEHTESGMLALYNSTRFIIIPVICPSGIAHDPLLYPNSNNVRINKNFEYYGSWERLKTDKGGSYPDSEVETKLLKRWLNKYADSDFWLDCHSDTGVQEAYLHLGTIFCSDSATASKFNANKQSIIEFYRNKGYYTSLDSPVLGFSAQNKATAIYPKTVYAKEITRIPSAMMEQFEYSTAWGSDGNTNNDSYAIKHYVAMIRYMVLEMCKDSDKFIFTN